jgi:uncharacterized cupredoxin-like copper-binding protein
MRTPRLSIALLAAGALAIAGCGSDDNGGDGGGSNGGASKKSGPAASGGESVNLSATDFKFAPADPTVKQAGTVTFKVSNDGQAPHALEVEGPGGEKETPVLQPGKTASLKVDLSKDGSYEFYCPVGNHRQMGMKGEVKVGGGGSGTSTSESEDDSGGGGGY